MVKQFILDCIEKNYANVHSFITENAANDTEKLSAREEMALSPAHLVVNMLDH